MFVDFDIFVYDLWPNLVSAKLEQIKGLVDALDWAAEAAVYSVGDELEITSRRSVREMGLWLVQNLFVGTGTTLAVSACGFPRRLFETIAAVPRGGHAAAARRAPARARGARRVHRRRGQLRRARARVPRGRGAAPEDQVPDGARAARGAPGY